MTVPCVLKTSKCVVGLIPAHAQVEIVTFLVCFWGIKDVEGEEFNSRPGVTIVVGIADLLSEGLGDWRRGKGAMGNDSSTEEQGDLRLTLRKPSSVEEFVRAPIF
jgi:hypothetical protein